MNTVDNKMSRTRFLSLCVVLILSITALPAADEEELRAAFDSALEALSNKDLGKFLEIWHPQAVLFTRNQTYAIDRAQLDDREWAKLFEDTFGKVISIGFPQRAVKFRVVGDTGMVWGMTRLAIDTRAGDGFSENTRLTAVFSRHEGAWKILHWNNSPLPRGIPPIR